jgi:hypothetical protein
MKVIAAIHMVPTDRGGRSRSLTGGLYHPTTVTVVDGKEQHWSLALQLLDRDSTGVWYALGHFMSSDAPNELLVPDGIIDLYEGPKQVGHMRVLAPANVVEELLATSRY